MRESLGTNSGVHSVFPDRVGNFTFVRELDLPSAQNYLFGLYASAAGEEAILKLWVKHRSSAYARRLLVYEIHNYRVLAKLKKQAEKFPDSFQIPAFYEGVIARSSCLLLVEYIHAAQETTEEFTEHDYTSAQEFVAQIGLLPGTARVFRTLSLWGLLMGFLPGLAFVCLQSRVFRKYSIFLVRDFFAVAAGFLRLRTKRLSHLDLKPGNILKSEHEKYLIDFQFLAFAHPVYELAFTWDRSFVIQQSSAKLSVLVDHLVRNLTAKELRVMRVMVVYGLLYDILIDHEQPLLVHERALEKLTHL